MSVRLDRVLMSSLHESFKNYSTVSSTITVSGTITTSGADFYTDIPYDRAGTIADVYISKQNSGSKRLANYSFYMTEFTSPDPGNVEVYVYLFYYPSYIRVNISVGNLSGVSKVVTTQVFNVQAVIFDAPMSS